MLNRITLMGRLVRDPELRQTQSGISVSSFSLAVERDIPNKDGNRATDFIDIVAWRGTAEFACKYFSKGSTMVVDGRLEISEWNDKEGNKRRTAQIVASNIYFGSSKNTESSWNDYKENEEYQNITDDFPLY